MSELPDVIAAWINGLAKDAAPKAKQAIAERDKTIKAAREKSAPIQAAIDKANAELAGARDWLANVPIDCEPSDIAVQTVIRDQWPARINELAEKRAPYDAEIRAAEQHYSETLSRLQSGIRLAINDASKQMGLSVPSVYDLV